MTPVPTDSAALPPLPSVLGPNMPLGSTDDANKAYEKLVNEGPDSLYAANYPELGGNLLLRAGGDITGDSLSNKTGAQLYPADRIQHQNASVGNWLWRQGTGVGSEADAMPTAWWINFGTYTREPLLGMLDLISDLPFLSGFTGVGTLGGGNLTVDAGGNAGVITRRGDIGATDAPRSEGLILAVGSTGRIDANGKLVLTGGGDLDLRVGGGLNPGADARSANGQQQHDLNGVLVNLRGSIGLLAGAIGGIDLQYQVQDLAEVRAYDPSHASAGSATGGLVVLPGDSAVNLFTRGDLVLGAAADPGRVPLQNSVPFSVGADDYDGSGLAWFSLWSDRTAITLFSAGGNLTPSTQLGELDRINMPMLGRNFSETDGRFVYPSTLHAIAASGKIYAGPSAVSSPNSQATNSPAYSMTLAPSLSGQLELLAANSIYAGAMRSISRAPTPPSYPPPSIRPFSAKRAARAMWAMAAPTASSLM